ncbi:pilus assembly protein [Devosia neptuniae]|uniref:pilus assembly protein n=1 Tax=Devosia TaxID=46913 RepID=UPI0022AEA488|nr:pilus assembly protein [Devosia neptuniae]MCZ4346520.1 pilus assembly protein [Devosia neptuniae]
MPIRSLLTRFLSDRSGNVAIICAFAFIPMLVVAGGATDIARHEAYRVQLQDGVDRAVLAAASLTQTRTIEATVTDYMKSVPFIKDVKVSFTPKTGLNYREVTVQAQYAMSTGFLPLIGVNTIMVSASATAIERRKNVEISLMLDVSGSMRNGNPRRIDLLKPAARDFIDAILNAKTADYTSVSIVPYAGQVNVGSAVFAGLGGTRLHKNSSCFEFADADYAAGMRTFAGRAQVPHFTHWNFNQNVKDMNWWWCPTEDTSISYLSNNAIALKQRITDYKMHDGTGTAVAMNWGLMLLDPSSRDFVQWASTAGIVPTAFAGRPSAFNDGETLKFIVLMTDGAISDQYRPKDANRSVTLAPDNKLTQSRTQARDLMYKVCNRAKANGVVVFTIGFEVDSTAATEMANCASSPSHFYSVTGLDIAKAFSSIASAIQKIRLTQ